MKQVTQLAAVIGLALSLPAAVPAQVAVAGFETDGSVGLTRADYDAMGRAMTALLRSELGLRAGAPVVEIPSAGATRMGRIDLAKARASATQAGAKYLIVGTLLDQYGDLRVEARLVNAATGDPIAVVRAQPSHAKREQLSESLGDLVNGLGSRSELGGAKPGPVRASVPVDALVNFGQGLRYEEAGDKLKAADSYRAALKLAPGLTEVTTALRRVGG
jgi:TolB-like protein